MSDAFYEPCEKHSARRCMMCQAESKKPHPAPATDSVRDRLGEAPTDVEGLESSDIQPSYLEMGLALAPISDTTFPSIRPGVEALPDVAGFLKASRRYALANHDHEEAKKSIIQSKLMERSARAEKKAAHAELKKLLVPTRQKRARKAKIEEKAA